MIVFYHFFFVICGPLLINPIIAKQKFSLEKKFMIAEGPNRLFIWANNLKLRLIVTHWSWQCYPLSCWASEKTESNRTSIAWWIIIVGYIYILYYIGIPRYFFWMHYAIFYTLRVLDFCSVYIVHSVHNRLKRINK